MYRGASYFDGIQRLDRIAHSVFPAVILFIILFIAAALILPFLGFVEVYQVSEGREGVVVNSIRETGNFILPLRHAELVPSKPPLFHWLGALTARMSGKYSEFELRFPSAIAALGLLLVTFIYTAYLGGAAAGTLSALLLLSTNGFLRMAADGRVDMLCCFFVTAAIMRWLGAYSAVFSSHALPDQFPARVYTAVAVLSGFAILTKGPLGMILPLLVMVVLLVGDFGIKTLYVLWRREWIWAFVIALPWYVLATILGRSAFLGRQVVFENVQRFLGGEGITRKPPWFYLGEFWLHAAPWSFVLLFMFGGKLLRALTQRGNTARWKFLPEDPQPRFGIRTALVWTVTMLFFFSLSAGKRSSYLLMILPPLCVSAALLVVSFPERWNLFRSEMVAEKTLRKVFLSGLALWSSAAVTVGAFAVLRLVSPDAGIFAPLPETMRTFRALIEACRGWEQLLLGYFILLFLLAGGFWIVAFWRSSMLSFGAAIFTFVQLGFVVIVNTGLAAHGKTHGYKKFAAAVSAQVPGEMPLTFIKKRSEESFDGFFFYMGRTIKLFESSGSADGGAPTEPGLFLARKAWFDEQSDAWVSRVKEVLRGGRIVDQPEQQAVLFELRAKGEDQITPHPP